MMRGMNGVRAIAIALLLAALAGAFGTVSAQESGIDAGTTASVSVSCLYDDASGLSTCDFIPVDSAGGAVYGVSIPAEILCAPVAGEYAGGPIYAALPDGFGGATVSFTGPVSVSGSATYTVDLAGGSVAALGGGLACDAESTDEPGATSNEVDEEPVVNEEPIVDEGQTVEDVPAAEDQGGEATDVEDVTVTIYAYDCVSDPSGVDPAGYTDCVASDGIGLSATIDGVDAGTATTDVNGWASFNVATGSEFVVAEDLSTIPAGYQPYGNGVAFITADADSVIVFIHLTEPLVGRLQIVNGSCPTSGEDRTEFRVIEPRSVAMADAPECAATGGTVFTVLGGSLPAGGISVLTGSDGVWRGYLPAGTYTVVDDSGASADVTVILDDVSVVIAVDYISHPIGVLNVSRFVCDADASGIEITIYGSEPTVGDDDGCVPDGGTVTVDGVGTLDLSGDGVEDIELDPGDYVITDDATGETAAVTVEGGARVFAVIQDLVVTDDGVSNPGGGGPGGGDPDPEPNPIPGDGTGGVPGTGSSDPDGGDHGSNAGGDGTDSGDDDATLNVTQLPSTGVQDGGSTDGLLWLLLLTGGLAAGAVGLRSARNAA